MAGNHACNPKPASQPADDDILYADQSADSVWHLSIRIGQSNDGGQGRGGEGSLLMFRVCV